MAANGNNVASAKPTATCFMPKKPNSLANTASRYSSRPTPTGSESILTEGGAGQHKRTCWDENSVQEKRLTIMSCKEAGSGIVQAKAALKMRSAAARPLNVLVRPVKAPARKALTPSRPVVATGSTWAALPPKTAPSSKIMQKAHKDFAERASHFATPAPIVEPRRQVRKLSQDAFAKKVMPWTTRLAPTKHAVLQPGAKKAAATPSEIAGTQIGEKRKREEDEEGDKENKAPRLEAEGEPVKERCEVYRPRPTMSTSVPIVATALSDEGCEADDERRDWKESEREDNGKEDGEIEGDEGKVQEMEVEDGEMEMQEWLEGELNKGEESEESEEE